MATNPDEVDTIEAHALSTSLDPFGQLAKMLVPRAACIAIYDRTGMPLWLSDGCDGPDLLQFVEESLTALGNEGPDPDERDGFARSWDGNTAYVFILRDKSTLLGALAISCQDASSGSRPFSLVRGLLRPVLQVLSRELANQYSIGDLRKDVNVRDGDLQLLLDASGACDTAAGDDPGQLVRNCVSHLGCALGALLIPDRKIAISHPAAAGSASSGLAALENTQRHLFAWVQLQRRTLILNKAPANSPLGSLSFKTLACPIRHGAPHVAGILALFRPTSAADFDARQVRVVEMMARRIEQALRSSYDPSTGLLTRPAFEQRVLAALAAAGPDSQHDSQHYVAYADVDRLHVINENHGMHVGDEAISGIAHAIRAGIAPTMAAARISGDRFAVFFPDHSSDEARALLERVCGAIGGIDFSAGGSRIALSMSFGLACIPATKLPLSHALAAAEVACKKAKERGRARVELHQDAAVSSVHRHKVGHEEGAIVGRLREAIANDGFRMEAQPIVLMDRHAPVRRFELLLRMIDPSGDSIAPEKLFTAAERYQLATDIDRWVVQYALEILSSAASALDGLGARFAINICAQSLGDEAFPDFLEEKLHEYGLPAGLLSFEITETAAVANIVRAEVLIRRLQELGHAIALDHFGRGLSSLTYLQSLPVSDLKIDGALVRELVGDAHSQPVVAGIVELAGRMKLRTTAQCVESEAILTAVGQLGVDQGQGFAIGRPRPLEIVLQELLREAPGTVRTPAAPRMARLAG